MPLVPFLLNGVIGNQRMLQPDFVHPNAAGAAEIARTIWPYLQPLAIRAAAVETFQADGRPRLAGHSIKLDVVDGLTPPGL